MNFNVKQRGYLAKPKPGLRQGPAVGNAGLRPAGPKGGIRPRPGAAPGAPQPAPAGIPAPPVGPLNDSRYASEENAINRNFNDANLGFNNQQYQVEEQFGFDQSRFAQNPYTRANLLQRAANQRFNSTTNSMAGRRQLYSGATDRARSADAFTAGAETDAARREYTQALAGIESQRLSAQRERDEGIDRSYLDMIDRAQSQDPDDTLFPQEGPAGKKGGGKSRGGAPSPQKKAQQGNKKARGGIVPQRRPIDPGFVKPTLPQRKKKK